MTSNTPTLFTLTRLALELHAVRGVQTAIELTKRPLSTGRPRTSNLQVFCPEALLYCSKFGTLCACTPLLCSCHGHLRDGEEDLLQTIPGAAGLSLQVHTLALICCAAAAPTGCQRLQVPRHGCVCVFRGADRAPTSGGVARAFVQPDTHARLISAVGSTLHRCAQSSLSNYSVLPFRFRSGPQCIARASAMHTRAIVSCSNMTCDSARSPREAAVCKSLSGCAVQKCDALIAYYATGFPLDKAQQCRPYLSTYALTHLPAA